MNRMIAAAALLALGGCQTAPDQPAGIAASPGQDLMAGTSWSFTLPSGEVVGTFGNDGRYYDLSGGKVVESGTFVTSNGQVCEHVDGTPAAARLCWTVPAVLPPVGGTLTTTSNKGQTLNATRVPFKGDLPRP